MTLEALALGISCGVLAAALLLLSAVITVRRRNRGPNPLVSREEMLVAAHQILCRVDPNTQRPEWTAAFARWETEWLERCAR